MVGWLFFCVAFAVRSLRRRRFRERTLTTGAIHNRHVYRSSKPRRRSQPGCLFFFYIIPDTKLSMYIIYLSSINCSFCLFRIIFHPSRIDRSGERFGVRSGVRPDTFEHFFGTWVVF